jgi:hypothetical protein
MASVCYLFSLWGEILCSGYSIQTQEQRCFSYLGIRQKLINKTKKEIKDETIDYPGNHPGFSNLGHVRPVSDLRLHTTGRCGDGLPVAVRDANAH